MGSLCRSGKAKAATPSPRFRSLPSVTVLCGALPVRWPAITERRLIEDLRAVSMALSDFDPISARPTLGQQASVAGAPLQIVAVVAGLQAHLNYVIGTGAIRSLMFERYVGHRAFVIVCCA